jgi:hypothetical protein
MVLIKMVNQKSGGEKSVEDLKPPSLVGYEIKILTSVDALQEVREYWETVQWHPGGDFNYYNLLIRTREDQWKPLVFLLLENGLPAALLAARIEVSPIAYRIGYASLAKVILRKLIVMEGGFMGNRSPKMWRMLMQCVDDSLVSYNCDLAIIENACIDSVEHMETFGAFNRIRASSLGSASPHWVLQAPDSWNSFLAARSAKRRYWFKRLPKILDRDFPKRWSIQKYVAKEDALKFANDAELVAKKTYHRALSVGFKADSETRERIVMQASSGQLRSYILYADSLPVAFWYCFRSRDTLYLASTGFSNEMRVYEPGTVLLLKIIEECCGSDIRKIDFGLGNAEYKQRFGSESFQETSILVFATTIRGVLLNSTLRVWHLFCQVTAKILERMKMTQRIKSVWRRLIRRRKASEEERIQEEQSVAGEIQ